MTLILHDKKTYVLRFDNGEDAMAGIAEFCTHKKIYAGHFTVIGACKEVILSYYNQDTKVYEDHEFNEPLEIAGMIGNVALLDGKVALHAHGTFGDRQLNIRGGHIKKLIISATGEVILTKLEGIVERQYNKALNLNLMNCDA